MNNRRHSFIELALAIGLLAPVAMAQKPPTPPTAPPPNRPSIAPPPSPQPSLPEMDLVTFLTGRIATNDGTPVPHDLLVERICNEKVRQQVYASPHGDFSMQMGSKVDSLVDASGGPAPLEGETKKGLTEGIPRRELASCDLQTSAGGFRPSRISLIDLTPNGSAIDVGAIVVQRVKKIDGMTLSAMPYKAPPNARKAYEKGVEAKKNGKLAEAQKYFEQAVGIYPGYASAWFQLGTVLENENQKYSARAAFTQAATIDTRFLPPYLSLASIAYEEKKWSEVLQFTAHIMDLDLMNHGNLAGYVLDLDELNSAGVYFYNAVANYQLNKITEAEKSALKAGHLDLRTNYPQLHLLLAEISARKKDYVAAISELQTYLELVPQAKDGVVIREKMAKLEKLSHPAPAIEKPVPN